MLVKWTWVYVLSVLFTASCINARPFKMEPQEGSPGKVVRIVVVGDMKVQEIDFGGVRVNVPPPRKSPILFTVPKDFEGRGEIAVKLRGTYPGSPNRIVETDRQEFKVLSPIFRSTPEIKQPVFDLAKHGTRLLDGYISVLLHGGYFDTSCRVMLDDKIIPSVIPSGWTELEGSPVRPIAVWSETALGEAIIALVKRDLVKEKYVHKIEVGCDSGVGTAYTEIPWRTIRIEIEQMVAVVNGVSVLPANYDRANLSTAVRSGLAVEGLLAEIYQDTAQELCVSADEEAPCCLSSKASVVEFFDLNTDKSLVNSAEHWYIHAALLPCFIENENPQLTINGALVELSKRDQVAIFTEGKDSRYLERIFLHELGHALNLTHCEVDGEAISIMTRSADLVGETLEGAERLFSQKAKIHLRDHPDMEVRPGGHPYYSYNGKREESVCEKEDDDGIFKNYTFWLKADKPNNRFAKGEPVYVAAHLALAEGSPLAGSWILDPAFGLTRFTVQRIDEEEEVEEVKDYNPLVLFDYTVDPAGGTRDEDGAPLVERSGSSKIISIPVPLFFGSEGLAFAKAGSYRISAKLGERSSSIYVTIDQEPPKECSDQIVEEMSRPEVAQFLYLEGGYDQFNIAPRLKDVVRKESLECTLRAIASAALGSYFNAQRILPDGEVQAPNYKEANYFLETALRRPDDLPWDYWMRSAVQLFGSTLLPNTPQGEFEALFRKFIKKYEPQMTKFEGSDKKDYFEKLLKNADPIEERDLVIERPKFWHDHSCKLDFVSQNAPMLRVSARRSVLRTLSSIGLAPLGDFKDRTRLYGSFKTTLAVEVPEGVIAVERDEVSLALRAPVANLRVLINLPIEAEPKDLHLLPENKSIGVEVSSRLPCNQIPLDWSSVIKAKLKKYGPAGRERAKVEFEIDPAWKEAIAIKKLRQE